MTERSFDSFRKRPEKVRDTDNAEIGRLVATPIGEQLLALLKKKYDTVLLGDALPSQLIANNAERALITFLEHRYADEKRISFDAARNRLWGYPVDGAAGAAVAESGGADA